MANSHVGNGDVAPAPARLTSSASFKYRKKNGGHSRVGSEVEDFIQMLHGSDPVRVELARLENEIRGINSSLFQIVIGIFEFVIDCWMFYYMIEVLAFSLIRLVVVLFGS